jgi:hypothetical protein
MIRGIIKNGLIHPLDPLPEEWSEGREVVVEEAEEEQPESPEEFDRWYEEMERLAADVDPQDIDRIMTALAEADVQAKEFVRREMGLP